MRMEISPRSLEVTLSAGAEFAWQCHNCPATAFDVTEDGALIKIIQTKDIAPRAGEFTDRKSQRWKSHGWQVGATPTLRVTVPPAVAELTVEILSGRVKVEGLQLERLHLHTGNGKLEARHVQVNELHLESDNGMATAMAVNATQAVIRCSNGVASLREASVMQHCRVEAGNGVAYVSGIEQKDFGYHVESVNGAAWVFGKLGLSKVTRPGSPCYTLYCHNGIATLR